MGCICPCLDKPDNSFQSDPSTHLLFNQSSRYRPKEPLEDPDARMYHCIQLRVTFVNSADKIFRERENAFNHLVYSYYNLKDIEEDVLQLFLKMKMPQTSMESCIKVIGNLCKKTRVELLRTHKYCMIISFDEEELASKTGDMANKLLIPSLQLFNSFNEYMKELQGQYKVVNQLLLELFQEEVTLRKNIMNADLGPTQEPESFHNCVQNLNLLRRCYGNSKTIHDEMEENWNNLVAAYRTFCE